MRLSWTLPARPTPQANLFGLEAMAAAPAPAVPFTPLLDVIGHTRRSQHVAATGGAGDGVPRLRTPSTGSGPPTLQGEGGSCICQRPHAVVLCHVCGWYSRCRLMKPCRDHPNTRFLLDLTACPRCRALSHLMSEYDMLGERIRPCTLPMPLNDNGPMGRRSPSPSDPALGNFGGAGGVAGGYGGGVGGQMVSGGVGSSSSTGGYGRRPSSPAPPRTRMRPPLQSDGLGMQRKARDRFCSHQMARTPNGLPLAMYYDMPCVDGGMEDGVGGGGACGGMCWGGGVGVATPPLRGRRRR